MRKIRVFIASLVGLTVLATVGLGLADEPTQSAWPEPELTAAERAWIKNHPVIRVGGPKLFPPFHWYNYDGRPVGIGPEYAQLILNQIGLRVDYQPAAPWPEVLDKIKNGRLDLIACAARSVDRESFLNFSEPYLSYPLVIITRRDAPFIGGIKDLDGRKIALITKVPTGQWLKKAGVKVDPVPVDTPLANLEAVAEGRVAASIENLAAAAYLIRKHGLFDLKVAAPTPWAAYTLGFAGRKDWPELISIINKTLAVMPPRLQTDIRNKWISVNYEFGVSPTAVAKWAAAIFIPAAIFVGFILFYNRRLRREIVERQKVEQDREAVITELQDALANIKQLKGLLPICAVCKNIRDDQGYWRRVEEYLLEHSEAEFSHSICPDCTRKLYPEVAEKVLGADRDD